MARLIAERHDIVPLLGEVFRRYGFEGASLARVGEQTKLGKGSLYHFFPGGKDEMAAAVLADIDAWFEVHVFTPLCERPAAEAIDAMFAAVADYFRSGRRICLVGAFALDDTRDRFAASVNGYFSRWLAALSAALARAGFTEDEAGQRATEVVAGIQGAIVLARALDDQSRFDMVLRNLRHSCLAPEADTAER